MTRKRPAFFLPLTTPRLILRPFTPDDLADVHAYACDPRVTRFMDWGPNTEEQSREFLGRVLEEQATWPRAFVGMAVEVAAERKVIGACRLAVQDAANGTGDFGYSLHADYWNRGYATEAAAAMIEAGFTHLGLRRIYATCDTRNTGSWTVMGKLGMRREATFRQDVKARRGWRDSYLYAILVDEWRRGRG